MIGFATIISGKLCAENLFYCPVIHGFRHSAVGCKSQMKPQIPSFRIFATEDMLEKCYCDLFNNIEEDEDKLEEREDHEKQCNKIGEGCLPMGSSSIPPYSLV